VLSPLPNSGKLRFSLSWGPSVNPIYKWMGIVFVAGIALMFIEVHFAKKKKEGFTPTDKQRVVGIFWLTIFFSLLIAGIIWFSPD
jgi:arginine exporter protein ArgO